MLAVGRDGKPCICPICQQIFGFADADADGNFPVGIVIRKILLYNLIAVLRQLLIGKILVQVAEQTGFEIVIHIGIICDEGV